ncbi:hypothetical protein JZ751_026519 [Albula glossodonta]|uniref:Uncharacterized protein n=1 Tax=Albula glossodonta TaxID=121402 RepID=A0A8T2PEN0_9TELE|nr:hypothetical protein JZ751_026519 [Albula glossodonta]
MMISAVQQRFVSTVASAGPLVSSKHPVQLAFLILLLHHHLNFKTTLPSSPLCWPWSSAHLSNKPLPQKPSCFSVTALGSSGSRSSSSSLSEARSITFSSRLLSSALPSSTTVFAPDLKKHSQEGVLSSSLPACSSSAKALLTNLSASSLSTEALLSSTLCQRLVREQFTSSNPLPVSSGHYPPTATTTASSPNFTSPSTSPSSPSHLTSLTLCSLGIKPTNRTLQFSGLNSFKEHSSKTMPKPVSPGSTQ